ncbi:MAG: hypothetical protein RR497_03535 [Oscillospiraceae bacterium]
MKFKKVVASTFVFLACFCQTVFAQVPQSVVNTQDKSRVLVYVLIAVGALAVLGVILLLNKKDKK